MQAFATSSVVIRSLSHPSIHPFILPCYLLQPHHLCRSSFSSRITHAHKSRSGSKTYKQKPEAYPFNGTHWRYHLSSQWSHRVNTSGCDHGYRYAGLHSVSTDELSYLKPLLHSTSDSASCLASWNSALAVNSEWASLFSSWLLPMSSSCSSCKDIGLVLGECELPCEVECGVSTMLRYWGSSL